MREECTWLPVGKEYNYSKSTERQRFCRNRPPNFLRGFCPKKSSVRKKSIPSLCEFCMHRNSMNNRQSLFSGATAVRVISSHPNKKLRWTSSPRCRNILCFLLSSTIFSLEQARLPGSHSEGMRDALESDNERCDWNLFFEWFIFDTESRTILFTIFLSSISPTYFH